MGAGSSTPAGLGGYLTRTDMLKATEQPRFLVDRLFSFFADNLAQKDILALANPARCSEYIFVMSDALDRLFYQLRLEPGLDKKGILYFRKAADLTKIDASSSEATQRKYLCLSLAFFYIRIFQIYAALALSVNDAASYGLGFGLAAAAVPGRPAAAAPAPGLEAFLATGGATGADVKKFAILKAYISADPTRPKGIFVFDRHSNLILKTSSEKQNLSLTKSSASEDGPNTITCDFYIRVSGLKAERRLLTFSNFRTGQTLYDEKLVKHGPFGLYVNHVGEHYESESGERADDLIYRVINSARDVALGRRAPQKGIPRAPGAAAAGPRGIAGVGESFVPEGLRTQFFMTQLRKIPKPLAHCVARSLQLLNIDVLASPKIPTEVKSSICKVKFETAQGGIPDIGKEITSSPGIAALNELFFDKISSGKPAIGDETLGSYQAFVKTLAESFGENPSSPAIYMSSVINKADKLCETGKKDKTLTVKSASAITTARQAVQMLWQSQIEHDKKVLGILTKLVVVQNIPGTGVKVSLNPLILKTGNPGVAIVAKEARELLTKYYSNCEKVYRIAAGALSSAGSVGV